PRLPRPAGPAAGRARQPRHPALRRHPAGVVADGALPGDGDRRAETNRRGRSCGMVTGEPNPFVVDDELAVLGLNTTRPARWKEGSISPAQVELIRSSFGGAPATARRVLVTHPPFLPPPSLPRAIVVHGREAALAAIREAGVELLLAGHLHLGYAAVVGGGDGPLSVQAGTAFSRRRRGQPNAYNVITLDAAGVQVQPRVWDSHGFRPAGRGAGPGGGASSGPAG